MGVGGNQRLKITLQTVTSNGGDTAVLRGSRRTQTRFHAHVSFHTQVDPSVAVLDAGTTDGPVSTPPEPTEATGPASEGSVLK